MKNCVEHRVDIQKNAAPPDAGRSAGLGGPFVMCWRGSCSDAEADAVVDGGLGWQAGAVAARLSACL
jgi:hypothetical protein